MAERTISASLSGTVTCQHEDSASFYYPSYDSAVSNATCLGGEVIFSSFRGWGKSYYFIVYIDGEEAFETREINDQNSSTHELITYIDTDVSIDSDAILKTTSGNIEVVVIDNTSPYTDDVCSFRDGCEITINASYKYNYTACGAPTSFSCSPTLTSNTTTLSWSGAKGGTSNAISSYEIQYCESSDNKTWGSWTALTTVTSSATNGTKSVSASGIHGNYSKFRIRTCGAAGSSYYSSWKESSNTVRRDHAALAGFTDPTLTAGSSPIKALHMTEMQDRVNTLRTFYGLSAYGFSTITAGTTNLAGWSAHVNEIRTAIDEVCSASGKSHEAWISFSVNCPRVDIMQQLRNVILSL